MTDNLQQAALDKDVEPVCVKEPVLQVSDVVQPGSKEPAKKLAYVKPALRKFSQIDYVTAYGID